MKRKRWLKLMAATIVLLFVIDVIAGNYFYGMVIKRGPKDFLQGNADLEVSAETMDVFLSGDWRDWVRSQDFERMELKSFDGLVLQGYYLPAKKATNEIVFFAHGYLGNAFDMGLYGEYYYEELGYNLFIPDLRGHGESQGDYYGFGWHDRLDIVDWLGLLVERNEDAEIILHGLSMGAGAVLMASGEELPAGVKGIIADSPYTSVYDMFHYQLKRMYRFLPAFPVLPTMSGVTKLRSGYSLTEASALEQVKKATVPILYIHGEADTFVPFSMSEELVAATNSQHELIIFPEANHGEAIVLHRERYYDIVEGFLADIK